MTDYFPKGARKEGVFFFVTPYKNLGLRVPDSINSQLKHLMHILDRPILRILVLDSIFPMGLANPNEKLGYLTNYLILRITIK